MGNTILTMLVGAVLVIGVLIIAGVSVDDIIHGDRTDLRLISQPYLEVSGIKDCCLASGGAWHEESDFVGCVGYGPQDCTTELVISGMTQCIGAGANWTCSPSGIYCRYQ